MTKSLIIVESPAKARTLQRYLGKSYDVLASVGHIRDLPVKSLGVDIDNDFTPQYVNIQGKSKIISELRSAAKKADAIYLAPDPDREGEAIAFHIAEVLKKAAKPLHRAMFHELTKKAVLAALENAADLNKNLFEAQQTRRILDRLVGYQISPLLWDKVRRGLSAGRVQSVTVRMICEREQAIEEFKSEEYWTIDTLLKGPEPPDFIAQLEKINDQKSTITNESSSKKIVDELRNETFVVSDIIKKEKKRYPAPPFITSTLQIEANRKLRFSAKKTMMLAQRLYEGIDLGADGPTGLITYMRTDSTRINDAALSEARTIIKANYGPDYLPAKPIYYKTSKSAQDAHEAVRPTGANRTPESIAAYLDRDLLALYTLVWKRFIACQMAPARFDQTTIPVKAGKYRFKTVGSIMRFPGFMKVYQESEEETASGKTKVGGQPIEQKDTLPDLKKGDQLTLLEVIPKQHFTQPPPRYNEATLVKALEENGVGRPSTYAAILSTIQDKQYAVLEERKFRPTDLGKLVNDLLVKHFPTIMDVEFTASMEKKLDQVEEGNTDWLKILKEFYGPFHKRLELAKQEMKSVKRSVVPTEIPCKLCDGKMVIKWGRMGEFLACENYPACNHTQDFKKTAAGEIVPIEREEPRESGEVCEKCGRPFVYKQGKFGKFLACSGYPECKNIKPESTGVQCPQDGCTGELIKKVSKRGKIFYACNRYPDCNFALWDKPVAVACPLCKAPFLLEKNTKKLGLHLKCATKACPYIKQLDEEQTD